jgi:TonB family protein
LPLFHLSRSGYDLRYTDDMHGRVASSSQAPFVELAQLRGAASTRGRVHELPLAEGAHGAIEVGDETVEFEVVPGSEPLIVPRRLNGGMALGAVLLLGGLLVWTLSRPVPMPPRATPTTTATPILVQPPVATPVPLPAKTLPPMTITLHPSKVAVTSGRSARRPNEVERVGTLRVGAPLAPPELEQVGLPQRNDEWSVGASDYTADGLLRPETVVRGLQQQVGAVRVSYERALRHGPASEGDLVVRIMVTSDGRVGRVTIVKDTLPSVELSRRVTTFLRHWRAPGPTAARAEYEIPFHFRAARPQQY